MGLIISLLRVTLITMNDSYSMEKLQAVSKLAAVAYKNNSECRFSYERTIEKLPNHNVKKGVGYGLPKK